MSALLSILRATHCRSTHHYFAIDALRMVQTDSGVRLRGLLLKHHDKYLTGAKDPDTRFRDFQNHVIHVQDGYFGGAPRLAIAWYDRLMNHLVAERWGDAAHAAGVLSHYFTDPLMPLHTAQSPRESVVHRPLEWSVCKSYERILKLWTNDELRLVFQLGDGDGWLGEAILKGARFANRSYKRLVEGYNVDLGVANPAAGLDQESLQVFAELFGLAITGLARILERVADQAETRMGVELPNQGLTFTSLLATLQVPEKLWLRRIEDKQERLAIEAIVDEFRETGMVKRNLPAEIYIKQKVMQVRQREAAWDTRQRDLAVARGAKAAEFVAQAQEDTAANPFVVAAAAVESNAAVDDAPVSIPFAPLRPAAALPAHTSERISRDDELSCAPSIGPKTAAAFAEIQIRTIGEFLAAPAASMARRLQKSWITATVLEDWQAQTWLMLRVPGLLSRDVQMLVGVGCRSADQLATADVRQLALLMQDYANTTAGRRALRGAEAADASLISNWIAIANTVAAERRAA